jgi:hypothetical protein
MAWVVLLVCMYQKKSQSLYQGDLLRYGMMRHAVLVVVRQVGHHLDGQSHRQSHRDLRQYRLLKVS